MYPDARDLHFYTALAGKGYCPESRRRRKIPLDHAVLFLIILALLTLPIDNSANTRHATPNPANMPQNPCEKYPPIAIVGMAMRLPGGVQTDKEFWELLVNKRDGGCRVPESRYNVDAFYSSKAPHTVKSDQGYFLQEDPACFDNGFFSMGEFEASRLDPQQRLLLQVAWECMEDAGQTEWRSKDVGCYVGVFGEDWLDLSSKDTQQIGRLHALGTGNFALSNRVSYEYDLTGPR